MASGQTVAADGSSRMAHCGWHMARLHSPAVSTWKMATYRLGSGQGQVPQLVQEVHPRDGRDRSYLPLSDFRTSLCHLVSPKFRFCRQLKFSLNNPPGGMRAN